MVTGRQLADLLDLGGLNMENMQDLLSDPVFIMQAESRSMIPQQYAATLTDQEIQGHLARIEVVNIRSPSPVLESGPAAQVDPLLAVPSFQQMARNTGQTPEQYLASLDEAALNVHRQILLGAERKPASVVPVLESGPASPVVKTQTPILTPVAEPYVEPVVVPAPAATQPAPALTSGNGSVNYSDLVRANGALSATEGDRSGAYQPYDYNMGAIAEPLPDTQAVVVDASNQPPAPVLEGYHQMPDGSMMPNAEMSNSTGQLGAMEGQYSTSPVLTNPAQPAPATVAALTDATGTTTGTTNGTTGGTGSVNGGLSATARTASGGSTGNARGSNMAYSKIDNGESLIRIGGAMYSGALQGNGIGAATQEYGSIQDANRETSIKEAEFAEAQRIANARQAGINSRANAKGGKGMPSAQSLMYGQAALSAIERTEALVTAEKDWAPWDNTTGIFGNLMKNFPSSAANDVMANIKTIEAAVGFDRLQAMRDASPTGGALGQVSNIELDLLKSSLANLNQSQSKQQFLTNLAQVKQVYSDIVNGPAGGSGGTTQSTTVNESDLAYING